MKPFPFDVAVGDAEGFILSPGCKTEVAGLYSEFRVDRSTVPDGYFVYDMRSGSLADFPAYIEKDIVRVNFAGSFITRERVPFAKGSWRRSLCGRGGYTFAGACDIMNAWQRKINP